ncbi:MAG: endonuclease/exonuclease/phosphatase family metal-dependent hydrolase [Rhodothermales bacterium]|jgi:endonuclease/exonuclease/phosphatase family metal-dependent hydrolase
MPRTSSRLPREYAQGRLIALLSGVTTALVLLASPGCTPAQDAATPISAMTFNIRWDNPNDGQDAWPHRAAWVADVIGASGASVVGLQEALRHQIDTLASRLPSYAWIGVGRDDGMDKGEFAPLFYRTDELELLDWSTVWLSETPADTGSVGWDAALPRVATLARFRRHDSSTLSVVNVHFDHVGRIARRESAALLASLLASGPGDATSPEILMGDFNIVDTTAAYAVLYASGLTDAFRAAGSPAPIPTFTGFDSQGTPGGRIDYVFVRNAAVGTYRALDERRNGRFVSDHRPVIVTLDDASQPETE